MPSVGSHRFLLFTLTMIIAVALAASLVANVFVVFCTLIAMWDWAVLVMIRAYCGTQWRTWRLGMRVRCLSCKEYVPKEQARQVGLSYVCGDDCKADLRARTIVRQRTARGTGSERRTDGHTPAPVRQAVLERDAYRCRFCGQANNHLHVHHIVYRSQGGPHEGWNLITLCDEHHALVHSNKRRYMPLLRAVIWTTYVDKKKLLVPQLERMLGHA